MNIDLVNIIFIAVKFLALFGMGLYIVFSVVILRQEQLMANVLEESFEPVLRLASILHMAAAVAVFLLAIFLL